MACDTVFESTEVPESSTECRQPRGSSASTSEELPLHTILLIEGERAEPRTITTDIRSYLRAEMRSVEECKLMFYCKQAKITR